MTEHSKSDFTILINRCIDGDASAWDELVNLITPSILMTCRQMRLSQEESLDIFGQVCYILLQNLDRLKSPEKILSYVSTTARREVLRGIRRTKLFEKLEEETTKQISVTEFSRPDEEFDKMSELEILMAAMAQLPEKEYKLLWHLFLDETEPSYDEISEKVGIPVSSIGPTRSRALLKLKKIMKRKQYKF